MERGGEKGEKIIPNDFGGSVGYVVLSQNFIDDQLVMKIKTEDIGAALEAIKDENTLTNEAGREYTRDVKVTEEKGDGIYIVKVE